MSLGLCVVVLERVFRQGDLQAGSLFAAVIAVIFGIGVGELLHSFD